MSTNKRSLRADWDQTGDRFVNSDSIPPAKIKLEHIDGNRILSVPEKYRLM